MTFFKIGSFTLGGGYAMLPLIEGEIVRNKKYLSEEEFIDSISLAQAAPGAIAVNISILVGYRIKGFLGASVSFFGTVLPSFLIILLVSKFFLQVRDSKIVKSAFSGVRPVVLALIISAALSLFRNAGLDKFEYSTAAIIFIILLFTNINPIFAVVAGIVISIIRDYIRKKK